LLGQVCTAGLSSLTGLFDDKQDGLATGVLIILEMLQAVVLIFVSAVHSICIMEHCMDSKEKMVPQLVMTTSSKAA